MSEPADFMRKLAEESACSMVPADPWSGIPDDLRKLVQDLGGRFADFGTWKGYYAAGGGRDTVNNSPGRTVELARHMNDIDAARDALCAALRELVADRERLEAALEKIVGMEPAKHLGFEFHCFNQTRIAQDALRSLLGATPGGAKEEAE